MVIGVASPVSAKAAPLAVADDMVTLARPLFESVIVWELVLPTSTFPNAKLPGLAISA